jgi:hypothetical protein
MSINSLPDASQAQMRAMQQEADKRMKQDGVILEETVIQPIENKHPMLTHHEEPVLYNKESQEVREEEFEYDDSEDEVEEKLSTETPQQMNFRMIKERAERAERERDEAMKYAMSFNQPKQQPQSDNIEPEEDYLSGLGIDNDGLAEGKHLKEILKEVRNLKKELHSYKAKATQDTVEVRIQTQYPDFNKVVSQDNLQSLRSMNPDLADMILSTPDVYKQAKLAYDMVKQYGIYKDQSYEQEKVVAQKNSSKPRPLASVSPQHGESPLTKANAFANGLTSDLKAQLLKEMNAYKKGY